MTNGAAKGSAYERTLAKELSLWWSVGDRDDLFWRSSQSGGRATQRAKKGKKTANACGDLCAQDPDGQLLLDMYTIEIKRGYNSLHIYDILEGGKGGMNAFTAQAAKAAQLAGTPYWLLVHKRDRQPAIYVTNHLHDLHEGEVRSFAFGLWSDFVSPGMRRYLNEILNDRTSKLR
jgi:hypothetical protein